MERGNTVLGYCKKWQGWTWSIEERDLVIWKNPLATKDELEIIEEVTYLHVKAVGFW